MMDYSGVEIDKLNHAAFKISWQGKFFYIDLFKISENEKADMVFVTHEHFDHLSPDDIKKVLAKKTKIISMHMCENELKKLTGNVRIVKPEESFTDEIKIETVRAYNVNKFREPGVVFHPKQDGKLGFILEIGGVRIYHAGDTDVIDEMKKIKNIDVALLPVSGTYVMTPEEAVKAADIIKPKIAVPMHWGAVVGTREDAENFKDMASCEVEIL